VPPEPRFLEYGLSVGDHLETSSPRRDHLQLGVGEALPDLSRQTGGSRLVVSNDAIFDADLHGPLSG
jgi:hypothetical protein